MTSPKCASEPFGGEHTSQGDYAGSGGRTAITNAVPSPTQHSVEHLSGSNSPALVASPQSSRNSSPSRQTRISNKGLASKKKVSTSTNHSQSPSRLTSTGISSLSVTAIQEAFSPSGLYRLPPTDTSDKILRPQARPNESGDRPPLHRPVSPRPKPPSPSIAPSGHNLVAPLRQSDIKPTESMQLPVTVNLSQDQISLVEESSRYPPSHLTQGPTDAKIPRGPGELASKLETVEEGDHLTPLPDNTHDLARPTTSMETEPAQANEHGVRDIWDVNEVIDDNADEDTDIKRVERRNMQDMQRGGAAQSITPATKKPYTALVPTKVRAANGCTAKLMTVETETVSSIPQAAMAVNAGDRSSAGRGEISGTLHLKPSSETIRSKKERKKIARKPASIVSGTAASKADIFEAKVASAVDEDSSDSDETFVYESNPPEPRLRQNRHHSRSPSTTSMQSLVDRRAGARSMGNIYSSQRAITGKRSMKFASNSYASSSMDSESGDRDTGTVRTSKHKSTPGEMHYQHIGHYGGGSAGHKSPLDHDSPFSQASRIRGAAGLGPKMHTKAHSSGSITPTHLRTPTKKSGMSPYEFEGGRADDEAAPLVGSFRTLRTRVKGRPHDSNLRHVEYYQEPSRRYLGRFASCMIIIAILALVLLGAAGFLVVTTKPLYGVRVLAIQNVLASEEEIMLDLLVEATNPNVFAITIDDMDVNVFAKSRHLGSDRFWRHRNDEPERRRGRYKFQDHGRIAPDQDAPFHSEYLHSHGGIDEGNDPIDDPEGDPHTMLLGRILHFDSALVFDSSPIWRQVVNSTGELRLARPGNKTEAGGSERWEHLLEHPFELIVRGILKYQIPLISRPVRASIGASILVHPEDALMGEVR